ncbi:MAG: antitoxin [Lachnospiraceae bacterium]|nr:antitoxin [Lachnospiraceae bacterium]
MSKVKMNFNDMNMDVTEEEIKELEAAERKAASYDEDCPEMTMEQLMQFKRINHDNRTKPTVSLRISPSTLQKAKQYGKGYTGFLSRLLDLAIEDDNLIRKCI